MRRAGPAFRDNATDTHREAAAIRLRDYAKYRPESAPRIAPLIDLLSA